MRNYELMSVVQGQIPEDLAKEVMNKIKSMVGDLGGKDLSEDFWGRRKLAYKIGGQEHGYYDVLNFQISPENVRRLEEEIKLIGEVIRYLMVVKEKKKIVIAKEKSNKETVFKKEVKEKSVEQKKIENVKIEEESLGDIQGEEKIETDESKKEEKEVKRDREKEEKEEKKDQKSDKKEEEKERLQELDRKIDEILKD